LADIKKNSTAEITRVLEALTNLNDKHFSFFYRRKLLDEEGREVVGSDGNTVEVDMTGSGPLVTVLEGSHAGSGRHMFYEIVLNPIFLDQRQSYFMLIPDGWRKELERLSGKKKMSAKTHLFLIYLRYSFEKFSRSGEKKEFVIETTQEEIAHRLRFSETTIKRAKKQILERLISCYDIAKRLGYLLDYDVGEVHKLTLNPKKYVSQTLLTSSPC